MVTSKQNYNFRKTHDVRIPFGLDAHKTRGVSLPDKKFRYGRVNRPQTPVKGIIFNEYGETARKDIQGKYMMIKDFKKQYSPVNNKFDIKYTNAVLKHDEFVKTQSAFEYIRKDDNKFKLKRFQNIEPKVAIAKPFANLNTTQ